MCNSAIAYVNTLQPNDLSQIQCLLDSPLSLNSKIRFMPDVHAGKGCTIGTTMSIEGKVCPNIVGVDIGCGMLTYKLKEKRIDLPALDSTIRKNVPAGLDKILDEPHSYSNNVDICHIKSTIKNPDKIYRSIGSLGSGNHFIEIDQGSDGSLYLVIHTGSRNLGVQVASYWQKIAFESCQESGYDVPYELSWLEGKQLNEYLSDMIIAQDFASWNRKAIAKSILKAMKLHAIDEFETIHNYIEGNIIRKGAISAQYGERVLIPMNMRDGSVIATGKGNPDWNYSAPHGAGRLMSRLDARDSISMQDYKDSMKGIYTTSVSSKTIDESPQAYKPMEEIIPLIEDTVMVEEIIKPIYNFKAE